MLLGYIKPLEVIRGLESCSWTWENNFRFSAPGCGIALLPPTASFFMRVHGHCQIGSRCLTATKFLIIFFCSFFPSQKKNLRAFIIGSFNIWLCSLHLSPSAANFFLPLQSIFFRCYCWWCRAPGRLDFYFLFFSTGCAKVVGCGGRWRAGSGPVVVHWSRCCCCCCCDRVVWKKVSIGRHTVLPSPSVVITLLLCLLYATWAYWIPVAWRWSVQVTLLSGRLLFADEILSVLFCVYGISPARRKCACRP